MNLEFIFTERFKRILETLWVVGLVLSAFFLGYISAYLTNKQIEEYMKQYCFIATTQNNREFKLTIPNLTSGK
ncbi:MAG: hypothetical protein QXG39_04120 [Candidatus Aenigmatarchaeota archaeon]